MLDSECTKALSGNLDEHLGTLPKGISALVESTQSNSIYKFGDAKETKAVQTSKATYDCL